MAAVDQSWRLNHLNYLDDLLVVMSPRPVRFTASVEFSYASLMKAVSQELLDEVTRRLTTEFHPEQVWLFGSYAWGQPDDGSDLDLLVVVSDSDEPPVRRAQRAHRCLSGLNVATDILVKTRAEFDRFRNVRASLEHLVLNKGRLIYG